MLRNSLVLVAIVLCVALGAERSRADPLGDLGAMLEEARREADARAAVLLVDDGAVHVVTAGDARPHTRFYLASVGKPMVAAAALSAVSEGLLALDTPLGGRVSGLPLEPQAAGRTLRQLLDHTSGLPDYLDDAFAEALHDAPARRWRAEEALRFADPADTYAAGRRFDYSNTNYVLAGALLARLDGTLGASMQGRVFGPAGMTRSSVGTDGTGTVARGYNVDGRDVSEILWNSTLGDGPVVADAGDVARFLRAVFGEPSIIGPAFRDQILEKGPDGNGYTLGFEIIADDWGTWIGHSGGFEGAAAEMRYYPEHDTILVVIANGDVDTDAVLTEAATIWFEP